MALTNLIGNRVSRSEIYDLPTPVPASDTHYPIHHKMMLNLLEKEIFQRGLNIEESEFVLDKNGMRLFGLYKLSSDSEVQSSMVGIVNSADMSTSASILSGTSVHICSNLLMDSDFKIGLRHTANILQKLPTMVSRGVQFALSSMSLQEKRYQDYISTPIKDSIAENIIIQLWRVGAIPAASIAKIVAENENPTHQEFISNGKRTLWTLQNSCTEILRPSSPGLLHSYVDRTSKIIEVLDSVVADQLH